MASIRIFLALLLVSITAVSCVPGDCYYCGSYYSLEDRFPSFDLCTECQCVPDRDTGRGVVICTPNPLCNGFCYYQNKKYSEAQTFTIGGSCVRCDCSTKYRYSQECGNIKLCFRLTTCK